MKTRILTISILFAIATLHNSFGQSPIIQTMYTADPAPMVYNDRLYLYTGHDEDGSTWFTMNDWRVYSTDDMVNWTDHGVALSYKTFDWASGDAWASQCIEKDGKFYFYATVTFAKNNRPAVGVAVADSPFGPFYDPLGKPLAQTDWGDIDPSVFIDNDGQAYLYWGNPHCSYVKLNDDMISYKGDIVTVPLTIESFAKRDGDNSRATLYEEGPWLYKRNNMYYLFWAGGPIPEHLGYSTSKTPEGPWKYGGVVMAPEGGSFTNHPGVIDFRGKTYLFYHNGALSGGGGFTRSVCVKELRFNPDGSIPQHKMTNDISKGLTYLNPYRKNEGETIAWSEGMKSKANSEVGVFVKAIKDGSYTTVKGVNFGQIGASKFTARVGTIHNDIKMEIRLDGVDGQLIGTIEIPRTGNSDTWALQTIDIPIVKDVHDVYFVFKGHDVGDLAYFDYWMFGLAPYATNPVVWADIPDMSMIRVGDTYYMSSTTMHMNPGVPVMKSKNLVDWEIVSYAYETLGTLDDFEMTNGKNAYGGGTWASSMRYHNGTYYISTFANNSGLNYIFTTKDPEKTPWEMKSYTPKIHDHSLFFDDDGKIYMLSCGGDIAIREVNDDFSGVKEETTRMLIKDADAITGRKRGLPAEGAQLFKVNGKYYIFLITWPVDHIRTVLVYRADNLMGPYEGKIVLEDRGIAQGGFIDTPDGKWYGYFFGDRGAVGRIPYIVPMKWENEWPVFGDNGIVPMTLDIKAVQPAIPAIVASDEFSRKKGEPDLPLVWQWNHNPNNDFWSVKQRNGFLRLTTFRLDESFPKAKNSLTQRTFGPQCSGEIAMDVSNMKDGDFAGLGLLQEKYGVVGVKMVNGKKYIYSGNAQKSADKNENYEEQEAIPFSGKTVYFKAEANFKGKTDYSGFADEAKFYYSLDGKTWQAIGTTLHMKYTLTHFMGYRFALFNYATKQTGGYVDFDYFRVSDKTNF